MDGTHELTPPPASARNFQHYEVCLRDDGVTLWELGRGAMGVSYKARDVNLDVPVALKIIGAGLPESVHARERFRREARAAAALRHPNVASVFHFGETPQGQCFYAMEFIEGETLAARVQREGPLSPALVVEIALQVTSALIAADERGLVHRDLKPANLMLVTPAGSRAPTRTGSAGSSPALAQVRPLVKVIDFGLAKAAVSAGADTSYDAPLTQDGGFLGTPAYASPEQAEGGAVDARADIYSLGVTLWFLLSGKVPFAARSLTEIYDRQRYRPLPVAQLSDRQVPAAMVDLLRSMLAADATDRPESPAALYEELERCRAELGSAALPQTKSRPTIAPRRRATHFLGDWKILAAVAALALLAGAGAYFWQRQAGAPDAGNPAATTPDRSIAVLPLEDLSEDKANAFFADGIQDDVLNCLTRIKELKVISRSSVMSYRNAATRNLREIGLQLGVATVLEGSVRRAAERVLVNVALIDTRSGRQLWAERYDRTLADALTLQGELATESAAALRATLSPEEKARVEAKPTADADAYVLYLRARDHQTRPFILLQDLQTAARLYRQALERDPSFALARARLAATLAAIHVNFQPTTELRDQAHAEAEAALRLQPTLGEAHLARAIVLYWTERDYPAALRELEIAAPLMPGSHELDTFSAGINRRQGNWSAALMHFRRALTRDPRNAVIARETLFTTVMLRDWPAAARDSERALALAPDNPMIGVESACLGLWTRGDLGPLRAALAAAPAGFDPDGQITLFRWDTACLARDFDAAERAVNACTLDSIVTTYGAVLPKSYLLGCVALARGDAKRARPLLEAACAPMEAEVKQVPRDAFRAGYLGLLYAYLGRKEEALRLGRRAVELLPESRDRCFGPIPSGLLALILARTGEKDESLALIERLLTTPAALSPAVDSGISQSELRLRWQWDPLRGDPRFERLLAGPEPKTVYR